jgi:hypothetical protein
VKQSRVVRRSGDASKLESFTPSAQNTLVRLVKKALSQLQRLGRPLIFVTTGVLIAFDSDHGNRVGLWWVFAVVVVSLAVRNDRTSPIGRVAWWTHAIFAAATLLGLLMDRLSPPSALSLAIALVSLEGIRGALRAEIVSAWASAALAVSLSVIVSITDLDTRHATGAIGVWAIVIGIFTLIRQLDSLIPRSSKEPARATK